MAEDKVGRGEDNPLSAMPWPDHLLSLDEWDAMPEDNSRRYELAEGVLQVSPRPAPRHQLAIMRLCAQLADQLPPGLVPVPEVEVCLFRGYPATVRVPDIVVVPASATETDRARFDAEDVVLAVEVISPGSARIDRVVKSAEYADAGIKNYWIVDLAEPTTMTAYLLVDSEYEEMGDAADELVLDEPAPVTIDVRKIRPSAQGTTPPPTTRLRG